MDDRITHNEEAGAQLYSLKSAEETDILANVYIEMHE